jgi:hypothetical protein
MSGDVTIARCERDVFIDAHQSAVARNIGCENGAQSPFDALLGRIEYPI